MVLFVLIGVVLLFIGCITILLYHQDNDKILEKEKLTDNVNIIFDENFDSKDQCLIDNELI